jgi:lipopolysaccharide transport system permease protein
MTTTAATADELRSASRPNEPLLDLAVERGMFDRSRHAADDLRQTARLWRLCWSLGWLDIKLRYRGSVLGPFWLTASTAVMVAALGVLYSTLFKMNLHEYLPFLSLSIVLWNYIGTVTNEACTCFTQSEGTIRSLRAPFMLHGARVIVRNLLVLAHNVLVLVVVYAVFRIDPGIHALWCVPGLAIWLADSLAICLLLGALGARFRDIPPVVASVMQIAFFISPIIWKPELIGHGRAFLLLNPFFSLMEIVRMPLLGGVPDTHVWTMALFYSGLLCLNAALIFTRVRCRLAYWV